MMPLSSFSGVFIGVDPIQCASLGESCDFNDFEPCWDQLGFQSEDREKQASMGFIMFKDLWVSSCLKRILGFII